MKILNNFIHYFLPISAACLMTLSLNSCEEKIDDNENTDNEEKEDPIVSEELDLSVTPSTLIFKADETGPKAISVKTNADLWEFANEDEWISVQKNPENPEELLVNVQPNEEWTARDGALLISATKEEQQKESTVKIKQEGKKNEQKPGCVYFEDVVFKEYILSYFDVDRDGEISEKEALNVKELDCGSLEVSNLFTSLRGVEEFKNLTVLYCEGNLLTELNLSGLSKLEFVDCNHNKIKSLNLTGCNALTALHCHFNLIEELDINNNCPLMKFVNCGNNALSRLDVSNMKDLEYLACESNKMKELTLTGCDKLATLACHKNELSELNLEGLTSIYNLICSNNQISEINVAVQTGLVQLECGDNYLEGELDLTNNPELRILYCNANRISDLKLENCAKITTLDCSDTKIRTLKTAHMKDLKNLNCSVNFLTEGLDLQQNTLLEKLYCSNAHLETLDVTANTILKELICDDNQLTTLDVSNNLELKLLHAMGNPLETLYMAEGQTISDMKLDNVSVIKRK